MIFGLGPATVGVQSIIAFVVFGRFLDSPSHALALGALVATGAAVEGAVLLILRLPPTSRAQRARLGEAYATLQLLATTRESAAMLRSAEGLDAAADMLAAAALFGSNDARQLTTLVDEGRRMRLELISVAGLRRRLDPEATTETRRALDGVAACAAQSIGAIGRTVVRARASRRSLHCGLSRSPPIE